MPSQRRVEGSIERLQLTPSQVAAAGVALRDVVHSCIGGIGQNLFVPLPSDALAHWYRIDGTGENITLSTCSGMSFFSLFVFFFCLGVVFCLQPLFIICSSSSSLVCVA